MKEALVPFFLCIISTLLTVITGIIVSGRKEQKSTIKDLTEAIKTLVTNTLCLERRTACPSCKDVQTITESHESLKSGFQAHSHTGLQKESVLYYKDKQ